MEAVIFFECGVRDEKKLFFTACLCLILAVVSCSNGLAGVSPKEADARTGRKGHVTITLPESAGRKALYKQEDAAYYIIRMLFGNDEITSARAVPGVNSTVSFEFTEEGFYSFVAKAYDEKGTCIAGGH